jgi:hypothetical protein
MLGNHSYRRSNDPCNAANRTDWSFANPSCASPVREGESAPDLAAGAQAGRRPRHLLQLQNQNKQRDCDQQHCEDE